MKIKIQSDYIFGFNDNKDLKKKKIGSQQYIDKAYKLIGVI